MTGAARARRQEALELVTDVLVIGGGPAGAWAALTARAAGAEVLLVDKGFFGTSGATAPSNTETWSAPPGEARNRAIARHLDKTSGLSDPAVLDRVLHLAYDGLHRLVRWGYSFPADPAGAPYVGNLRGPDYMRFMRRRVIGAGVQVRDHHPAVTLTADAEGVTGAEGVDRQFDVPWSARASAVVLATGGCAFGERFIGATGLTGDGLLMAVEAGATLSGMEMSSQYAVTPAGTSLNKGMPYRFASFFDADGQDLGELGDDRQLAIAHALRRGPVYARLDKATALERGWLRQGQPNCFLPYDRAGIDPFVDKFEITLRCEGTVRGVGGVRLAGRGGDTGVAGLYAAGDLASREDVVGAVTGGGGPNSSWAIASGISAGETAAALALASRSSRDRRSPRHTARHAMRAGSATSGAPSATEVITAVRSTMLPLPLNFFRSADSLAASRARLDETWTALSELAADKPGAPITAAVARQRETAAMLACARWALAGALHRQETRGMHRRSDFPKFDGNGPLRLGVRGIDLIELSTHRDAWRAAS